MTPRNCRKCKSANLAPFFGTNGAPFIRCSDCGHKTRTGLSAEVIRDIVRDELSRNGTVPKPLTNTQPVPVAVADTKAIAAMVRDAVAKFHPQSAELKVVVEKGAPVTVKIAHAMLTESLKRYAAGFENQLLVGPAGSGKSTLAKQVAECLKRKFGFLSLSGGTTEGQLLGRLTSTGKYLPSLFVQLYENGGVFLLDEVDAADPNVLLVLNSALANGHLAVPARTEKPTAERHKNFVLLCAANTWGTGADWQYVGRNQLDAAFLSRFAGAVLAVEYDERLERALVEGAWYTEFLAVRTAAATSKLRRVMGTRELIAGQRLLKAGYSKRDVWMALTAGWTNDERSKGRVTV